ncbi:MAG TPA: response regulator transcription factor [Alloacidobacterium sp.]|nr:response regulator transcription factor [Alloacidobacterium sp.]
MMTSEAKQKTVEGAVPAPNGAAVAPHVKPLIRVIMADSQAIYRVGMRKVFAVEEDIQIVAQVDSLTTLQASLPQHPADVLVLEGNLLSGKANLVADILHRAPELKIIVQATSTDEAHTVELYRRGVRGVIPRSISPDLLVKCVRKIAAGETWIDNQSVTWVIEAYRTQASALASPKNQPRLSPKELAIINHITQGKRNKEIAFDLGTSEQVIKNYLRKIYDKLGVSDRLELALYCLHHQIHTKGTEAEARASIEAALGETAKL